MIITQVYSYMNLKNIEISLHALSNLIHPNIQTRMDESINIRNSEIVL